MEKILILGASGFIGSNLYKELCNYFDTYGTYHTGKIYSDNKHYIRFAMETDDVYELLLQVRPSIIISALRGDFDLLVETHRHICEYAAKAKSKIVFLSSANVFDAFSNYPSYEFDKTLSESKYGKLKIKIENMLMRLPERQWVITRLPMVYGKNCPRIKELRACIANKQPYEVFPDLVMNVTHIDMLCRQLHYIINRKKKGIYHLGSTDLVHHDEFVRELAARYSPKKVVYKNVYTSNFDRYLAVLPKHNKLPEHLQLTHLQVVENCLLK